MKLGMDGLRGSSGIYEKTQKANIERKLQHLRNRTEIESILELYSPGQSKVTK